MSSYEPIVRDTIADPDTDERVKDYTDPFPYVKSLSSIQKENIFTKHDESLLTSLYNLSVSVYEYDNKNTTIDTHDRHDVSELKDSILQICDIAKNTIHIFKTNMPLYSNLQKMSYNNIQSLYTHVKTIYLSHEKDVSNFILNINGKCPDCLDVIDRLTYTKYIIGTLSTEESPSAVLLNKISNYISNILNNSNDADNNDYTETIDRLDDFNNKCEHIGMSFSDNLLVTTDINIPFYNDTLGNLHYTSENIDNIVNKIVLQESIDKCISIISPVLDTLYNNFDSICNNIDSLDNRLDILKEYMSSIVNTIIIAISIYRSSIISERNYTTLVEYIFSQICNMSQLKR